MKREIRTIVTREARKIGVDTWINDIAARFQKQLVTLRTSWYVESDMAIDTSDTLRKATGGDREALTALLREYGETVRRRISPRIPRRWRSVLTIDDVMQEAYTEAALNITGFQPRSDGAFGHWLTTLAANSLRDAIDALETEKRGGGWRKLEPRTEDSTYAVLHNMVASHQTTPSGKLAHSEVRGALDQAIERLPDNYQYVVRRFDLEGWSIQEVAAGLGRSPGATFMLRARAHRLLRELMGSGSNFFSGGP